MSDSLPRRVRSLYAHVPFCAQKCAYCAFYSEPSSGGEMARYAQALIGELGMVASLIRPATVFFGGGTPSLLPLRQWQAIFEAMDRLGLLGAGEFTIECNPATVSQDKARLWREHGVNRISMGVQSLNADLLSRLGRVHSRDMVFRSFDLLRRSGFDNVNLDVMFAIPGQTLPVWQETLTEILAMGSEHLSCYEVIYEEDTALFAQLQAREFKTDEELACEMFDALSERAAAAGFWQYEIANFARHQSYGSPMTSCQLPSRACRHNVNYWRGGSFVGVGPSATSYVNGVRTKNWSNTQLYCAEIERGMRPMESNESLHPLARAGETAAFGLRMVAGWRFDEFQDATGFDLRQEWSSDMASLERNGWGTRFADGFCLTPRGLRFADSAAELFLR